MWPKLLVSVTILFVIAYQPCMSANRSDSEIPDTRMDDPLEYLYHELSTDAYFNLPYLEKNATSPTRRQNAKQVLSKYEWDFENDQEKSEPALWPPHSVVDTERYVTDQSSKKYSSLDRDHFTIAHLCFAASYIWRRGRKGIHRYYPLRDLYSDHMPFEIGYITQHIMAKYQNVLEIYEMATRLEGPENKIGRPHLWYLYKNILEECQNIIHLCNMMHEVTRKYRLEQTGYGAKWADVPYDPTKKFQEFAGLKYNPFSKHLESHHADLERGLEGQEHEKYLHEGPNVFEKIKEAGMVEKKERHRMYLIQKPFRQFYQNHGSFAPSRMTKTYTPISRVTRQWRPKEEPDYGWSIERMEVT